MPTIDSFFAGQELSKQIFDTLYSVIITLGSVDLRVTKSQIAFRRKRAFAWVWIPGKYLTGKTAPLVLTLAFSRRDSSPRWKEVVEPYPGRFTHHLELYSSDSIDDQVRNWLQQAWSMAGEENGR